jgi:hypothetical protein
MFRAKDMADSWLGALVKTIAERTQKRSMTDKERRVVQLYRTSQPARGKWNTNGIRRILAVAKIGIFGPTGAGPSKASIRKREKVMMKELYTRRQLVDLHTHEVREKNKENGLNRHGFPIRGLQEAAGGLE